MHDRKLSFPASARNRVPILEVLRPRLSPPITRVLEIACGSGEHAVHFAAAMPWLTWQPTDIERQHRASVDAWVAELGLTNVLPAERLDVTEPWPEGPFDAVYCSNMIHIVPWETGVALLEGAARVLRPGGLLLTYGPYKRDGQHTSPSNHTFDLFLKGGDPDWGVRDIGDLVAAAAGRLELEEVVELPANNFVLVWRRPEG
jgi:SAM-dependent methyltransferase